MLTKMLIAASAALAALLVSPPGVVPAQAMSFAPVPAPVEVQASSGIERAAMRGSGRRIWTFNRGGFGGSRYAYRGGSYGRSYAPRRYGRAYPRHRYVHGRYYRHAYRHGYPWWVYDGAVGLGFGGYYGYDGYGGYGDYDGYGGYGDYDGYGDDSGYDDYGSEDRYASGGADGHVRWCLNRYRSYDPRTDTFGGYDGRRHKCRAPY